MLTLIQAVVMNRIGIKQCGSDEELAAIVEKAPKDFLVYTGEDAQSLTTLVLGGQGTISVASHLFGNEMATMRRALNHGDITQAGQIQWRLMPKMAALLTGTRQSGAERPTLVSRKHAPTNFTVNHQWTKSTTQQLKIMQNGW